MGQGFYMYAGDYNNFFPLCYSGYDGSYVLSEKAGISWIQKVGDYLHKHPNSDDATCQNGIDGDPKKTMRNTFFWCKTPVVPTRFLENPYPYGGDSADRFRYGMNATLHYKVGFGNALSDGSGSLGQYCGYKSLNLLMTPSKTSLVLEITADSPFTIIGFFTRLYGNGNGNIPHDRRTNVLFVDGHVSALSENDILAFGESIGSKATDFWVGTGTN